MKLALYVLSFLKAFLLYYEPTI